MRNKNLPLSYKEYWTSKGDYGLVRIERSKERKSLRKKKSISKRERKRGCASWYDPNSPTGYTQNCSYYGTCQSPCNGDC